VQRICVVLIYCITLCFSGANYAFAQIPSVDFDVAMKDYAPKINKGGEGTYNSYRALYLKNAPALVKHASNPLIPKIIHHIWLGPKPLPKLYQKYRQTWIDNHKGWEHKLWTDKEVAALDFPNKDLFYKASSYHERADILRYELLYKYGGLYIDTDYICLKPFDDLHYMYKTYLTMEPYYPDVMAISIMASAPNNPLFQKTLSIIRSHWDIVQSDPQFSQGLEKKNRLWRLAIYRTMLPFNQVVQNNIGYLEKNRGIILPSSYLYPLYPKMNFTDKFLARIGYEYKDRAIKKVGGNIKPETMSLQDVGERAEIANLAGFRIKSKWEVWYQNLKEFFAKNQPDQQK